MYGIWCVPFLFGKPLVKNAFFKSFPKKMLRLWISKIRIWIWSEESTQSVSLWIHDPFFNLPAPKKFHSGEWNQTVADSYVGFTGYVWTDAISRKKKLRIQKWSALDPISRSPFLPSWHLRKVELFSAFISHFDYISSWKCSWKCKSLEFKRKKNWYERQ